MARYDHQRRKQIIREAEGYLDLLMALDDRWPLAEDVRDRVASRAIETLGRVRDAGGDRSHVLYLHGQALRVMHRFDESLAPLEQAAEIDPENIHVHLALGWCHKRSGRLDLAIESLEDALVADPSEAIIHFSLACYWSLAANKRNAIDYLSEALAIDPNYRDLIDDESDFDLIRDDPEFLMLTSVIV